MNRDQQTLVTNIAELIIPQTDTPGATAVKVPEFTNAPEVCGSDGLMT